MRATRPIHLILLSLITLNIFVTKFVKWIPCNAWSGTRKSSRVINSVSMNWQLFEDCFCLYHQGLLEIPCTKSLRKLPTMYFLFTDETRNDKVDKLQLGACYTNSDLHKSSNLLSRHLGLQMTKYVTGYGTCHFSLMWYCVTVSPATLAQSYFSCLLVLTSKPVSCLAYDLWPNNWPYPVTNRDNGRRWNNASTQFAAIRVWKTQWISTDTMIFHLLNGHQSRYKILRLSLALVLQEP
jgi:hypothetical protein